MTKSAVTQMSGFTFFCQAGLYGYSIDNLFAGESIASEVREPIRVSLVFDPSSLRRPLSELDQMTGVAVARIRR